MLAVVLASGILAAESAGQAESGSVVPWVEVRVAIAEPICTASQQSGAGLSLPT